MARLRGSRAFALPAVVVFGMGVSLAPAALAVFFLTTSVLAGFHAARGFFLLGVIGATAVTRVWRWGGWIVPTQTVLLGRMTSAGAVLAA